MWDMGREHREVQVKRIIIVLIVIAVAFGASQYLKTTSAGTALEKINEKRGTVGLLLEEREVSDGEVVFYIKQDGERSPVLYADYVKKTFLGWRWAAGGGHSMPAAETGEETIWSYQYIAATKGTLFGQSPFPLIFGSFSNPAIKSVVVKSVLTGEETQAVIEPIPKTDGLWYAFISGEQGKSFELKGLSETGELISEKRIN
jgi:hypothetical protein